MKCAIRKQVEIKPEEWNNFVCSNSMGWAYFLYDMIGFDRWSSYINLSFAIVDEDNQNEILMIQQLHETKKQPLLSLLKVKYRKLHSRWGYVLKDNLPKKQFRKIKECYESFIDEYIIEHNIKLFDINLPPLSEYNLKEKSYINPLIYLNFAPKINYTYIVDLSKPYDRMLADCEETTRQAIRKIEASDKYEIIKAQSNEQDLQIYIKLHKETYTRTNSKTAIIADEYHRNMFFNLLPKNICKIYFLKDKETQEIIATAAILIYKKTAYYWWGDSKNDKEVGINKYLLFKIICEIRELFNNTGFFETGGAFIHLRKGKEKGLNDFKKCFGTTLLPIWGGEYSYIKKTNKMKAKVITILRKIVYR